MSNQISSKLVHSPELEEYINQNFESYEDLKKSIDFTNTTTSQSVHKSFPVFMWSLDNDDLSDEYIDYILSTDNVSDKLTYAKHKLIFADYTIYYTLYNIHIYEVPWLINNLRKYKMKAFL